MVSPARTLPDLDTCELEPIRFPGAVQPHGVLLVVDRASHRIEAASESSARVLGCPAIDWAGRSIDDALGAAAAEALFAGPDEGLGPVVAVTLPSGPMFAQASRSGADRWLIDIEPGDALGTGMHRDCRRHLSQLRGLAGLPEIVQSAAAAVRELTGFERVMVYRFDEAWNGEVIAESRSADVEAYLGLNYPASDIPAQARQLFEQTRVRLIPDIDYTPSALVGRGDVADIDLGSSSLRSVSPLHIEYCRQMGVRATLVGALVVDGRLWGLLACHHESGPRYLDPGRREDFGGLCEDLAALIGTRQLELSLRRRQTLAQSRRRLVQLLRAVDFKSLLREHDIADLFAVVAADGFALQVGDRVLTVGLTPSVERIRQLQQRRRQRDPDSDLFSTWAVTRDLARVEDGDEVATEPGGDGVANEPGGDGVANKPGGDGVAGALFVSVSRRPSIELVWFRSERSQTLRWAGDPAHPHHVDASGRLSPRHSFAEFKKQVRGQSLRWTPEELASAAELGALIEIDALRQSEAFTQTIFDSSPEHLCVLDAGGVIVSVNEAWRRFGRDNGAGDEKWLGMNYLGVCAAAHARPSSGPAGAAQAGIQAVLDRRRPDFGLDYPCDTGDQRRWFHMAVFPMQAPGEGVVVLHSDITQRKLAELALSASEQRYKALLEDQTELISRVKADGTVLYVNPAFCRFFGTTPERMIGQGWKPVIWSEDLPLIDAMLRSLSPACPVVTIENRVLLDDGSLRWGQFVNRGFFDDQGRLQELQCVGRDITERKQAEARVASLLDEQRAILDSRVVGILRVKAGHLVWANLAAASMFGYAVDELVGQPTRIFFGSDEAHARFVAAAAPLMQAGAVYHAEVRQRRKDGSLGWFDLSVARLADDPGEHIGALVDISARKAAEAELEQHRQRLERLVDARTVALTGQMARTESALRELQQAHQALMVGRSTIDAALASMSDAVLIADSEGRCIDFNEAFASFHRCADKAACSLLASRPELLEIYLPSGEPLPPEQWAVPRALRGETASGLEFTLRRRDSGESWIGSFNHAPIRDPDGRIIGAVVSARDITEHRRAEIQLRQAKEAAEAANRAKTTFLATMSHELRTPLNAIMGLTSLLQMRAREPRQLDQLGKVQQASLHLLGIIDDVLDLSRIEADRFELEPADFVLGGLLESAAAMTRVQLGDRPLVFTVDAGPGLRELWLHGDSRRLLQVLLNLTGNAVKFTRQGHITLSVQAIGEHDTEVPLRFEVRDTGIGIAAQDQHRIFKAFEQVDGSMTRQFGGSGLGLSVCRRLVELMGGQIGVDSEAGVGSCFWFTLRLARAARPAAVDRPASATPSRSLLISRHAGAWVLVVDDDPLNREVSQGLLEACGLVVHLAENGAQAVEKARCTAYDLILMDVQMPVMDGLEATQRIRQPGPQPQVPIIAMTAGVYPEDEASCLAAGMNAFIGRPIASEALFATVLHWLDHAQAAVE